MFIYSRSKIPNVFIFSQKSFRQNFLIETYKSIEAITEYGLAMNEIQQTWMSITNNEVIINKFLIYGVIQKIHECKNRRMSFMWDSEGRIDGTSRSRVSG